MNVNINILYFISTTHLHTIKKNQFQSPYLLTSFTSVVAMHYCNILW